MSLQPTSNKCLEIIRHDSSNCPTICLVEHAPSLTSLSHWQLYPCGTFANDLSFLLYLNRQPVPVDLAKGYHLMNYSPTGVEATAVELQDSTRTLCQQNCKLYRLRSA